MLRFGTLGAARITPRALIYPCVDEPRAYVSMSPPGTGSGPRPSPAATGFRTWWTTTRQVIDHDKVDAVYVPLHIPAHHEWTLIKRCRPASTCSAKSRWLRTRRKPGRWRMRPPEPRPGADGRVPLPLPPGISHGPGRSATRGCSARSPRSHAAFHVPVQDPNDIRMNYATGGGVTMDIGCYPVVLGQTPARRRTCERCRPAAEVGPPDVDVKLTTELRFCRRRHGHHLRPTCAPTRRFQAVI